LEYAVVADKLVKYYGNFMAVKGISFRVKNGEIFGFLGPNGAGKTTTVRMLCGLARIDGGRAFIYNFDAVKETTKVKKVIGVVPDISNLYMELSCFDNLIFCSEMYGVPRGKRKDRAIELLEFFGLSDKKNAKFKTLSKGLKRRLVIAAALVHNPKLLFLDEPTIGLDVKSKRQIWRLIHELNRRGITIFLTTHNIYEAFKVCDRIAIINKGKIIVEGTPTELCAMVSGNKVIELQVNPPIRDPQVFSEIPGVTGVKIGQGTIRVMVNDVITALEGILKIIKGSNREILVLNLTGADAEDIFVKIIDKDGEF